MISDIINNDRQGSTYYCGLCGCYVSLENGLHPHDTPISDTVMNNSSTDTHRAEGKQTDDRE